MRSVSQHPVSQHPVSQYSAPAASFLEHPVLQRAMAEPAATRLRITRRGRAVVTTLVVAPLLLAAAAWGVGASGAIATSDPSDVTFTTVTVDRGESLWSIASELAPELDPRDAVAELMSFNRLDGAGVSAGQRLSVPVGFGG